MSSPTTSELTQTHETERHQTHYNRNTRRVDETQLCADPPSDEEEISTTSR